MTLDTAAPIALALALLPSLPGALAGGEHDEARALYERGEILSLSRVLEHAHRHHPGRVLEVGLERERGRYVYELEVLDAGGVVWELEYDARSGALIESERED